MLVNVGGGGGGFCSQICVGDGYLEIVRGMCVSLCLGVRVFGWESY